MQTIQIEVTSEEVKNASDCLDELFKAISKSKQSEYLYELNQIGLFIGKAGRALKNLEKEEAGVKNE